MNMSDTEIAAVTPVVNRGRGRPPKGGASAAEKKLKPKEKRAPGRPKKVKRGRPPMPKKDPASDVESDNNLDADGNEIVKRGRGRPKNGASAAEKKPKVKRGPGRPPSKRRGRPPMKKAKANISEDEGVDDILDEDDSDAEEVVVKKPAAPSRGGRPKKADTSDEDEDATEEVVKKPATPSRGRPKKQFTSDEEDNDEQVTEEEVVVKQAATPSRGRPQKAATSDDDDDNDVIEVATPSRDRPVKVDSSDDDDDNDANVAAEVVKTPKANRGRPKKFQSPKEEDDDGGGDDDDDDDDDKASD